MTDLGKLRALEARLAAATGPDSELDKEIARTFSAGQHDICSNPLFPCRVPGFTSSLDAAIAFCEAMLPESAWGIERSWNGAASVYVKSKTGAVQIGAGETAALSICSATIRALINASDTPDQICGERQ